MAKILIAEDEPDIRELVAFMLRFAGYEVMAASNGEEAVQAATREVPDLVLMDVRMPRMTGYEACAAIKTEAKLKAMVLINNTRLSVQPVTAGEWKIVCKMGGL